MGIFDKWKKKNEEAPVADAVGGSNELTLEQASPVIRSIVNRLGYPCQVFSTQAGYEEVMDAYEKAVLAGKQEGFTPVLVPADNVLEENLGILKEDGFSLEDVLKAEPESGEKILQGIWEADADGWTDLAGFIGEFDEEPETVDRFTVFQDYRSRRNVETVLLKVPTVRPWELVAYVPFGGWNECPDVKEMMAICKYWFEKYGAVPVTISHDVMEMRVPTPVKKQDSLQAAKEHYAFDADRVEQCTRTGTLSELAACIAASRIWYFWWD